MIKVDYIIRARGSEYYIGPSESGRVVCDPLEARVFLYADIAIRCAKHGWARDLINDPVVIKRTVKLEEIS